MEKLGVTILFTAAANVLIRPSS